MKGLEFSGELGGNQVWGEAYLFHNKGIGYVMVIWAAQDKWDSAKKELVPLRDSFAFACSRRGSLGQSVEIGKRFRRGLPANLRPRVRLQ